MGDPVTAIAACLAALFTFANTWLLRRGQARIQTHLSAVHDEVRMMNGETLGEVVSANETRRVEAIPESERTESETHYLPEG